MELKVFQPTGAKDEPENDPLIFVFGDEGLTPTLILKIQTDGSSKILGNDSNETYGCAESSWYTGTLQRIKDYCDKDQSNPMFNIAFSALAETLYTETL